MDVLQLNLLKNLDGVGNIWFVFSFRPKIGIAGCAIAGFIFPLEGVSFCDRR